MAVLFIIGIALITIFVLASWVDTEEAPSQEAEKKRLATARAQAITDALVKGEGFAATRQVFGCHLEGSIALDEAANLVCLVDGRTADFVRMVYRPSQLIDVALIEDGATITETRTSRGSQVAGAIVGGVLLGGAGMILGGLSGKQIGSSSEVTQSIDLRITVDDLDHPVWTVPFYRGSVVKGSPRHREVRDQAVQWQGLLSILIRRADTEEASAAPFPASALLLDTPSIPAFAGSSFHVCRDGQDIGPMPVGRIQALIAAGKLSPQGDMYFDPQMNEWMPLELLPA